METLVSDADHLWIAAAQLLRAQVSEAVWLSTFQDARADRVELETDVWMDQAGLETWLRVEGKPGRWTVDGRRVAFHPDAPLAPGSYTLVADARLEDVCGNSFQRSFEMKAGSEPSESPPATVSRGFTLPR